MAEVGSSNAAGGQYRPEIDGLRGFAVLAVMLFHSGHDWFRAGYLGVDIFFAISGFLITGILVEGAGAGRLSLGAFYMRRIRRIIPALVVMCLLVLLFAVMLMIPEDLENFGQSLFATAAMANNVLLYLTSGYFQQQTEFKPLFHTWSLGVEEQYYLLVPLLLMLALRLGGRRGALLVLALCSAASLLAAEWLREADPKAGFLLLPSRFWELGLGGMAWFARARLLARLRSHRQVRQMLVGLGLAMLPASLFVFADGNGAPGWQTLLPLLGTCLVLTLGDGGGDGAGASRLLTLWPVRGLGLISYSAYLWHVPLYAFVRITSLSEPSPLELMATLPLSLLLAWLSWRFIERPFRDPARTSNRRVLWICGSGLGLMASSGLLLHMTSGFFSASALAHSDAQLRRGMTALYNEGPFAFRDRPFRRDGGAPKVLVMGNSYARDFINMGLETGALDSSGISYHFNHACDPLPESVMARAREADGVVFGSGVAGWDAACTMAQVRQLEAAGVRHVVVLGLKQFGYNNNAVMLLPEAERYTYRAKPLSHHHEAAIAARAIVPPNYLVDLFALLDDGTGTVPVFTPDRKFISQDTRHLTQAGARFLGEKVFAQPQFAWLGWKPGAPAGDRAAGNQPS